jgi:LPXTG-motif cell wall-anchored protein
MFLPRMRLFARTGQASTAEQATVQAPEKKSDASTDTTKQEASDDLDGKKGDLSSLINRAKQDGLSVTKEAAKTYATKKEALDDLDKQVADIQSKVTKYESDKAAYGAAKKVYDEDLDKWNAAQSSSDPHMVKGISQGLSFTNEHDASLDVTSGSDKSVNFIKSSAWLGKDGEGVYTDGMKFGGNISKSFSESDISHDQGEGTGKDIKDWGNTYTGVQLKVGESAVASYTGLKNSVYIDNNGATHKLSKVQVKYKLNETTAKDRTANIFLSNSPNIALWYGAAGDQGNGRVDLTVDLTFYDENGKPITLGKDSNAWLDMSSLNNGTTKVEYFAPNRNTTKHIPGSTIVEHNDGWYADGNNEGDSADWDHPTSANRYKAAAIMELEGNSFNIGQKITKYMGQNLTDSRNVYSWFALDSSLATAYNPVEPKAPEKPSDIAWHEVTYEPQKATVTYYDDTDNKKILKSDSLEGDSNSVASFKDGTPYTTKSSIEYYENKGYEFVSDNTNGQKVVFDNDSSVDQSYEVHLKHGTVTVTPGDKNPVKPGDKINPNDPDSHTYQDDVKHDNLAKDAKQTIHYEGAGKDTPEDKVTTRKDAFTRTVTYDKVTGKSTTSDWSKTKTTFGTVDTPVVNGYTANKKQAGGLTATPDHPEVEDTVVYTPNGSIVPVDPNGNPIPGPHPVPYETDPTDPTKVVDGKVPEVPGWTPKNGKPGDPVKPSDPTKDTEVPDDHTMTPGETTATGKVEGLPEKLVKTPVKAPKAVKEVAQAQDQLPQTGEDNSKAAFGLGLASILGGIGILGAFKRKKKEN